ncbi:MAG: phenylalanine--tRNA ligase subunit beta [Candidatus Cloacimonetes bacterium]|nr:phenylalanine--tRNA ligase subunit beta [Candidatus Cloacimonadota bacterium]
MKISYNWLKELVPTQLQIDEFCEKLTMFGLEVEEVTQPAKDLDNIVVGKVLTVEKHPNADKLHLCSVEVGKDDPLSIICGAPNVVEGILVPVAMIGAKLGDFEIKKAKLRGVESYGMICSERELGISDDHSGIMVITQDIEPGTAFADAMGLNDHIIEVEVTPNRPDLLGMIGVAREVSVMLDTEYAHPEITFEESNHQAEEEILVIIEDSKKCPRYCARVIRGITVQPSPMWMQKKLIAAGLRPINNIVDVTNYVLLEYGHPLHAFDYSKISDNTIVVRTAKDKEIMMLLDDTELTLNSNNLLITDPKHPLALAGIMGGLDSSINEDTKDVVIECAYFDPKNIRASALEYGLQTESSYRFERGMDPNGLIEVIDRAEQLIQLTGGGKISQGVVDCYPKKIDPNTLPLRVSRTNSILNASMNAKEVEHYLQAFEFKTKQISDDKFEVTIPTFRPDIEREIDIIEELARCYGYNNVESHFVTYRIDDKQKRTVVRSIKNHLISLGFYEVNNMSFGTPDDLNILRISDDDYRRQVVELTNPIGEQFSIMRPTLIPDLLKNAALNISYKFNDFKLFELNRIYLKQEDAFVEPTYLTGVIVGKYESFFWGDTQKETSFYDAKGILESIFVKIHCAEKISYKISSEPYFKKNSAADLYLKEEKIGSVGVMDQDILESYDVDAPVILFDIDVSKLIPYYHEKELRFKEIVKYPSVLRDIALIAPLNADVASIQEIIISVEPKIIRDVQLFDVYTGKQIKQGFRSLAFNISFQSDTSTLTDKYVDKLFDNIVNKLSREHQIELRQE